MGSPGLIFSKVENGVCGQFGAELAWYNAYAISTIGIIPLLLTTTFGALAHLNIKRSRIRIIPLGNVPVVGRTQTGLRRRDRELLKMVLGEVFVHFLTNILYPIIIIEIVATSYMNAEKSILRLQIKNLLLLIARILFYMSNASPFYIFYAVSETFRENFEKRFANAIIQGFNDNYLLKIQELCRNKEKHN
ncbi:hypothetical protein I4U23_022613 [Adineta vaga]|nr:hypothetical protein I4U23_022613 [Adineta vaga]